MTAARVNADTDAQQMSSSQQQQQRKQSMSSLSQSSQQRRGARLIHLCCVALLISESSRLMQPVQAWMPRNGPSKALASSTALSVASSPQEQQQQQQNPFQILSSMFNNRFQLNLPHSASKNDKQQQRQSQSSSASAPMIPKKVLVTGAAGKTGRLVLQRLLKDPMYSPKALVRDEHSAKRLYQDPDIDCPLEDIVISDIASPTFHEDLPSCLRHPSASELPDNDWHAMIVCTSAVPVLSRRSLVSAVLATPWNKIVRRQQPSFDTKALRFKWKHGGYPEKVDYHGQLHQFQLAQSLDMNNVVLISSMGGTDPKNFLNSVGKRPRRWWKKKNRNGDGNDDDMDGHGNLLIWKRRAEQYLVETGLGHVILHPGGLFDDESTTATTADITHNDTSNGSTDRVFALDVDDRLGTRYGRQTRISRSELADLCVASLSVPTGTKISLDCITVPSGAINSNDSHPTSAQESLDAFLTLSKTASYV